MLIAKYGQNRLTSEILAKIGLDGFGTLSKCIMDSIIDLLSPRWSKNISGSSNLESRWRKCDFRLDGLAGFQNKLCEIEEYWTSPLRFSGWDDCWKTYTERLV